MRAITRLVVVGLLAASAAAPALAGGNANFVLGGRQLDEDQWEPVEDHAVFGATVDFAPENWVVNLAIGTYFSAGQEDVDFDIFGFTASGEFTAAVAELTFGVVKTWEVGNVRPFVGGGVAAVKVKTELELSGSDVDDDDTSGGLYVHGGVYWRIGSAFNIGLEGRVVGGTDIELFGESGDVDYVQLGMILGWGWD